MAYPFGDIEKRWQKHWADHSTFRAENSSAKPKYYALDMFPYPSGAGLHVGHPLGYIASDIVSRYKRLKGFNVLHPMGYDSFGLPAEQYAIQTGQHPEKTTKENIARYRSQMDKIGFSFDWDREVQTSDPNYYKWTQWIFLKLFNSWYNSETDRAEPIENLIQKLQSQNSKVGTYGKTFDQLNEKEKSDLLMNYRLAFLSEAWVNWCPQLGTVLANEEVKDGVSERGGYPVERKLMPQWSLRITAYADRLLNDLEKIDWSESTKESQRNWIGRSEGSSLKFQIASPHSQPLSKGEGGVAPKESGQYPGYHTAKKKIWKQLKAFSKENRKDPTEAEAILWECVRDSKLGDKIRRQHAIDKFIVDFVCLDKKLIIEVDGEIHLHQQEEDEGRTFMLEEIGYRLIRFTNEEVINKTDWVCNKIREELMAPFSSGEGRGDEACIEVFTTRPDTTFGVTFLTLAPESELIPQLTTPEQKQKVEAYVHYAKNRSELERQSEVKKVTGEFTGSYAIHPFTGEKLPIWIGDYVLAGYGTGAVMGVPAHDTRDFAFAKQFGLEIKKVIAPNDKAQEKEECFDTWDGRAINSDFINGLEVKDAVKKIIAEIEKRGLGKGKTQYRIRDAVFGRQRYWGEPIPVYYEKGIPKTVKEEHLPIKLPAIDKYLPTETGEPPLARAANWYYDPDMGITSPPSGGGDRGGVMELTTMPGWAGSSWYYLRYMDPKNEKEFVSKEAVNYWKEVDLYIGGSEHATGHLLYVRFWTKFLYDLGLIPIIEPAKKLINQGMILGESAFVIQVTAEPTVIKKVGKKILNTENTPDFFISEDVMKKIAAGDSQVIAKFLLFYDNIVKKLHSENNSLIRGVDYDLEYTKSYFTENRIPVEFISSHNELNIEKFSKWAVKYWNLKNGIKIFTGDNQVYVCPREVEKMSKSKLNVVTPDDICENFGADTLRLYEMFLGPLEMSKPWNTNGISGVFGFLNRFWRLFHSPLSSGRGAGGEAKEDLGEAFLVFEEAPSKPELKILHKTIKKIQDDIEHYSFNTSVSAFMICTNELTDLKCNKRAVLEPLVILLSPFAPHIAEELWHKLGNKESISSAAFPVYNAAFTEDDSYAYPISFNGKMRFNLELPLSLTPAEIEKEVLAFDQTKKYLEGKQPKKVIVVPKKIVNIVV